MRNYITLVTILAAVFGVVVIGIALFSYFKTSTASISDDTTPLKTQTSTYQYVFPDTATQENDWAQPEQSVLLSDWANSENIRTSSTTTHTPTVLPTPNTSKQATATYEPSGTSSSAAENNFNPWAWLPQASQEQTVEPQESSATKEYRAYGNTYGDALKQFANTAGNQSEILDAFVKGRGTTNNTAAITALAARYETLGAQLADIEAPDAFTSAGAALAQSYTNVGEALFSLSEAADDTDTLDRVYAYNTAVEEFAGSFLRMSDLFGALGVTFKQGEDGDIFMPPL